MCVCVFDRPLCVIYSEYNMHVAEMQPTKIDVRDVDETFTINSQICSIISAHAQESYENIYKYIYT